MPAYIYGGLSDCNNNGELDLCDIADEVSADKNNNGIPDECDGGAVGPDDFSGFRGFYDSGNLDSIAASVSLSGDAVLIGASFGDAPPLFNSGAAYVFRFDGKQWTEQQKLTASDGGFSDQFGRSVSLSGQTAIIGAALDDDYANGSGSSYIYTFDGAEWSEAAKLRYEEVQGVHAFGISVSTDGEHAIVGASFTTVDEQAEAGAAYIYGGLSDCNNNGELDLCDIADEVSADKNNNGIPDECDGGAVGPDDFSGFRGFYDSGNLDSIAASVSLSGDAVLIGASFGDAPPLFNSGAAYVFRFDGKQWTEQQKLTASDGGFSDQFGRSVSLSGQTVIIGALVDDDVGNASGSAYIFTDDPGGWIERAKLHSSDLEASDLFGASVSIDKDRAFVGATHDDDDGSESGSAYVFGGLGDCNENGELDLCDIADEFSTDKNNNGIPDECESSPCPWDLDDNDIVGASDVLALLASWGRCKDCPADFDNNGFVGASDILALLANWGPCP